MTSTQRVLFGAVASFLLVLGFVKAAESFDPIIPHGRPNRANANHGTGCEIGASSIAHWT